MDISALVFRHLDLLCGLPQDSCAQYIIGVIHIIFILNVLYIITTSWDSQYSLFSLIQTVVRQWARVSRWTIRENGLLGRMDY